jgi:pyridoxine kinase
MPHALIFSSFVAAGGIGGGAQVAVLARRGIEATLVPTVMLGRSPAKGAAGRATEPDLFRALIADVEAEGAFDADLVITGHFSFAEQVEAVAQALGRLEGLVVVDPVLGDAPKGLYVKAQVAEAVAARLVPQADWIAPNLWELAHLSGRPIATPVEAVAAARSLGRSALVTSAPLGESETGMICCTATASRLYRHPRAAEAPNGTGDFATALFAAGLIEGLEPWTAAERTAAALADRLAPGSTVRVETIDG